MTVHEERFCPEPPLRLEHPGAGIVLLTLDRPALRNALDLELRRTLAETVQGLDEDPSVRVIVISGGPTVFAAGADLGELVEAGPLQVQQRRVEHYWQALAQCRKPIIAAVNGLALGGGCELALHADLIVAGATARFGQPEVRLGIMPGAGGTQRLVRAVGKYQALRLLLTGCLVGAEEALAMGLASEVAEEDALPARWRWPGRSPACRRWPWRRSRRWSVMAPTCPWKARCCSSARRSSCCSTAMTRRRACAPFSRSASRSTKADERVRDHPARCGRLRRHGPGHRPAGGQRGLAGAPA